MVGVQFIRPAELWCQAAQQDYALLTLCIASSGFGALWPELERTAGVAVCLLVLHGPPPALKAGALSCASMMRVCIECEVAEGIAGESSQWLTL